MSCNGGLLPNNNVPSCIDATIVFGLSNNENVIVWGIIVSLFQ